MVKGELVYLQDFPLFASAELVIFVSRHQSRSGVPLLSVHAPGNLSLADFGGVSNRVSIAPANAMRAALLEMDRQRTRLGMDDSMSIMRERIMGLRWMFQRCSLR